LIGSGNYSSWQFTIAGNVGATGETGATGATGAKGDKGDKGDRGGKGDKGDTGPQGPAGNSGAAGAAGATGAAGLDGFTTIGDFASFASSVTQKVVSNSPTAVTYNSTGSFEGVYLVNNSQISFTRNGKYNIAFSFQVTDTAKSSSVDIWIRRSGVDVPLTNTTLYLDKYNSRYVAAWNFFVDVDNFASDYYQIMWYSNSTTAELT